jgi:hypothetical protein
MPSGSRSERERIIELLAESHDDPDLFHSTFIGGPGLWEGQRRIAQSVADYRITVAYTGNGLGKDYMLGRCVIPWWMYTRTHSQVIVTAPSQNVLGSVTWKELRFAGNHSKFPLGMKISPGIKASPLRAIVNGDWGALGYSTTSVERASGQHNRKLLVIGNEASGISDDIFDALDSLKYVRLLLTCNPIRARGRVIDLIHQAKKDYDDGIPHHRAVNAIQISSLESPDADKEESDFGLADKTWLADVERRYGKDSLWYRSHVLAQIPTVDSDNLIPASWLDRASAVPHPPLTPFGDVNKTRWISCDLGEGVGRDSTCVLVRDDLGILEIVAGNSLGLAEAAREIARLARKWQVPHNRISYDRLGVGRDLRHHLKGQGIDGAIGYAGSGAAKDPRGFYNLRTECAWKLRTRLNPDWSTDPRFQLTTRQPPFSIPPGEHWAQLREELEQLTYDLVGKQTRLISKEDHCAELGRSPDRCDALMQSFAFT